MTSPLPHATVDLTGLPEPVVRGIRQLVKALRDEHVENGETPPTERRKPLIGRLAHLKLKTPALEDFQDARREAWADFPRELPDPARLSGPALTA